MSFDIILKEEPGAIADVELTPDSDGVQRWVTPNLRATDDRLLPAFSAALLARAKGPVMPESLLLAPAAPLEAIPAFRLIDVLHCLDRDSAAIREAFSGKVVLVGSNLAEEDRSRTPDRFMQPPRSRGAGTDACSLGRLGASNPDNRTSPGVFVHAAAMQSVLTGNIVRPLPPAGRAGTAMLASVGGALLGFSASPGVAVAGVVALALALFVLAVVLLAYGLWFPVAVPAAVAIASMVLAYFVRFLVEERRRRRVQNAFTHYLAPSIVEKLVKDEVELSLGGELREVTIMFADFSGFTALSGRIGPAELMDVTNTYLRVVVDAVESTGGYVDKFIGDAVMGVWGAPVASRDHAASAARAALKALDSVMRVKSDADAHGAPGYTVKIGLNSGLAVVGNVGAPQRYNYTAIGEAVNVAARLESVPGDYGCRIVVGPATAAAIGDRFVLCELDWIRVKGKEEAIAVYELLGEKSPADAAELGYAQQYQAALERYRAADFAAAEKIWRCGVKHPHFAGAVTSPPPVMALRCAEMLKAPPIDWDGVFVKTSK
jgi:adenylate cyclase